jgi:hypothetical protein
MKFSDIRTVAPRVPRNSQLLRTHWVSRINSHWELLPRGDPGGSDCNFGRHVERVQNRQPMVRHPEQDQIYSAMDLRNVTPFASAISGTRGAFAHSTSPDALAARGHGPTSSGTARTVSKIVLKVSSRLSSGATIPIRT